jgi:hypothetical protein
VALSKHFKKNNLAQKFFELHLWVKKCHFGNFSEIAGLAKLESVYSFMLKYSEITV